MGYLWQVLGVREESVQARVPRSDIYAVPMAGCLRIGRIATVSGAALCQRALCVAASGSDTTHAASKPMFWLLLAAGGSITAHVLVGRDRASQCQSERTPTAAGLKAEANVHDRLKEWLKSQGMQIDLVEVKQSQAAPGAGLGMFVSTSASIKQLQRCMTPAVTPARRWWWPFGGGAPKDKQQPLATFPLTSAITASNILHDPSLGKGYAWMLERNMVDERTIIMAYLIIERLKGESSKIAAWIDALPTTFDTPVMFSQEVLQELKGTPLHTAQGVVKSRLKELWSRLQPAINGLLQGQPGVSRQATFDDLLWAYSVFWSRGQSLPVPTRAGAASRLLALDPKAEAHALLEVEEGIVPGLDFCNHHTTAPNCWWEVVVPEPAAAPAAAKTSAQAEAGSGDVLQQGTVISSSGSASAQVQLRVHAGARLKPGEELLISYGDKSNEELLMLYGFAVPGNPHDHIMLHCPLPPVSSWDDAMHARMELLMALRHDLQFFLPSISAATSPPKSNPLPEAMLKTLEVFTMNAREVAAALQGVKSQPAEGAVLPEINLEGLQQRKASMSLDELTAADHRLGLRLGACATMVKLLEARIQEQEGEEGTGTLEHDQLLLKDMQGQELGSPGRQQHACIVYRCEQKRIAQEYLRTARAHLQEIIALMQEIDDNIKQRKRG